MSQSPIVVALLPLSVLVDTSTGAIAQITAAGDNTGTIVNQNGSNFAITGGTTSNDGSNLFHNFADFNLSSSQIATFSTNPTIQNILSKISGGNPSYIDGLLQVSGSDANLFLLNPSGIIFGSNARLDLSGDFTASTASSLAFGNQLWTDSANLSELTGNPTQFIFDSNSVIINAANLEVNPEKTINLFASNIINTGSLKAPQGNIQITAIKDTGKLHLNQAGHILALELTPPTGTLQAIDLPALLTGGNLDTGLTLNNGDVILATDQSVVSAASGTTTITGNIDTSGNLGGSIHIFGDEINLINANLDASGLSGGGEILIGGDRQGQGTLPRASSTFVDRNSVLNASAIDTGNGGKIIVWSDEHTDFDGSLYTKGGVNNGDGGFAEISSKGVLDLASGWSRRVNLNAINGKSGNLLLDPTDITIQPGSSMYHNPIDDMDPISNDNSTSLSILLDSDIRDFLENTGDLEITTSLGTGGTGNITVLDGTSIIWNSNNSLILTADNNIVLQSSTSHTQIRAGFGTSTTANITLQAQGQIIFQGSASSFMSVSTTNGNLSLIGNQEIIGDSNSFIATNKGNLTLSSNSGSINFNNGIITRGGNIFANAANDIQVSYVDTSAQGSSAFLNAGNVEIIAGGYFRATGFNFYDRFTSIDTSGISGGSDGNISIFHGGNGTVPFIVGDASVNGTAGAIRTGTAGIFPSQSFFENYNIGNITIETDVIPDSCFEGNCTETEEESSETKIFSEQEEQTNEQKLEEVRSTLSTINRQTEKNPALLYIFFHEPQTTVSNKQNADKDRQKMGETQWEFKGDRLTDFLNTSTDNFLNPNQNSTGNQVLELALVTSDGLVIRQAVPGVTRSMVLQEARTLVRSITNPQLGNFYLGSSQRLYNYLIRPIEDKLGATGIENLSFVMDEGLRTLPIAALHDGQQFVIEKYSLGMMPSFSLINKSPYIPPRENTLLAMGAETFPGQTDLPSAPLEIQVISQKIWQQGENFLEEEFTVENLIAARKSQPYGIVHLATHGEFLPGQKENSYIQFKDRRLPLTEIDKLGLGDPPIELLILSACRTAYGDRDAELGFAGLALASGAKAAIGSVWYVSDEGTLALMTRLYEALKTAPIKAEALREAQLAMLSGEVRIENGELISQNLRIPLPETLRNRDDWEFSHPFFWSGFTLVGNPW